jgi:hypothetical protein
MHSKIVLFKYYTIVCTVQSFAFKLRALRSIFLYISIGFSLTTVAFYMKKTVQYNTAYLTDIKYKEVKISSRYTFFYNVIKIIHKIIYYNIMYIYTYSILFFAVQCIYQSLWQCLWQIKIKCKSNKDMYFFFGRYNFLS